MSIGSKITVVVLVLASVAFCAAGYAGLVLLEGDQLESVRGQSRVFAEVIRSAAANQASDHGQLGEFVETLSKIPGRRVVFYDRNAKRIAPVSLEAQPSADARIRKVLETRGLDERVFRTANRAVYVRREPLVTANNRIAGAFELRVDVPQNTKAQWFRNAMLAAAIVLLILAAAVATFAHRAIGRPIGRLMNGMDHVIRGDLTHAIPLERNDEIGKIAYRFNEMTSRLRVAVAQVQSSADARVALEKRVRQSEKLATVGQLSAEIAHEVGTPLNVISGRAALIKRKAKESESLSKNAQIIIDQSKRISRIIEQVLDMARAPVANRQPSDIVELVDGTLVALETLIADNAVVVNHSPGSDIPPVSCDPDAIQQVILNIVHNAVQAMPDGGTLDISESVVNRRKEGLALAPAESYVEISVSDQGPGIDDDTRAHIFEAFYSTKAKGKGTGLGLTISLGIVKEHDGWIEVSNAEPQGTRFRVFLPIGDVHDGTPDSTEDSLDE